MAQKTLTYLKGLWIRAYKPLEQDFVDFFDSFWHKSESIPQSKVTDLVQALDDRQLRSEKGQGNGYAGLDNTAKVPLSQLPDFAFLIKKADFASLDVTGAERNIYLTENDNKLYYWNGTAYELLSDTSNYQLISEKNTANGYVGLNGSTKIDATYLPSFVDDVIEVADFASLPTIGETGKIYLTLDNNKIFRWSGTVYVEISAGAIPTIQAVLEAGNEVSTDTLIKNGNNIIQLLDNATGVAFFGQVNNTNYGDSTQRLGLTLNPNEASTKIAFESSGINNIIQVEPALNQMKWFSTTQRGHIKQNTSDFEVERAELSDLNNSFKFNINTQGWYLNTRFNADTLTTFNVTDILFKAFGKVNAFSQYTREADLNNYRIFDEIKNTSSKASSKIKADGNVWEQHDVTDSYYSKIEQTQNGLLYTKVENSIVVQSIYLNQQTISALQFVDDSFTSQAVTGAIGSTGASVTFTTELKNIPYVFVNGLRFKVGVNATPANNICFLGPDASTVRTSLGAIVSGDLLFWNPLWNPLFANSFDLSTTDEIILNYTKV